MSVVFSIDTTASRATVSLSKDRTILAETSGIVSDKFSLDAPRALRDALETSSLSKKDIDFVAVNIGPGRLSFTRGGVSFANGIAFSLKKPILPLHCFDLLGFEAFHSTNKDVICVLQASNGLGYISVYSASGANRTRYGALNNVLSGFAGEKDRYCIAGSISEEMVNESGLRLFVRYPAASPSTQTVVTRAFDFIEFGDMDLDLAQAITDQHGDVDVYS